MAVRYPCPCVKCNGHKVSRSTLQRHRRTAAGSAETSSESSGEEADDESSDASGSSESLMRPQKRRKRENENVYRDSSSEVDAVCLKIQKALLIHNQQGDDMDIEDIRSERSVNTGYEPKDGRIEGENGYIEDCAVRNHIIRT